MTDDDQPDTTVAPTENLPTMAAPEQAQAWSNETDEMQAERQPWAITRGQRK
jgi:hypothetical protein